MNRRAFSLSLLSLAACHEPLAGRLKGRVIPAPQAPQGFASAVKSLVAGFNGDIGVAVRDLRQRWSFQIQGDRSFPQQSVSKIWVAVHILDGVDRGVRRLGDVVVVRPEDLSVFSQLMAREMTPFGYVTSVGGLLQWALGYSDNAADDMLIRLAGGAARIEETLRRKGIVGIRVGSTEHELQCRIAGIEWRPEYIDRRAFEVARAAVAPGVRSVRVAQYLADPDDGATPRAMVDALAALHAGRLLSEGSTDYLLTIMGWSPTGPERLRGGLPPDWTIAHKTGTGPEWNGAVVGINDVGLLTAPDGHAYAVAVFIAQTRAALPERLALMQGVARAVVDTWAAGRAAA